MALNGVKACETFISEFETKYTSEEHSSFKAILASIAKKDKVEFDRLAKQLNSPQKIRYNEYKADWKTLAELHAKAQAESEAVLAQARQRQAEIQMQKRAIIHQYGSQLASSLKEVHVAKPGEAPRSASGYKY